jgi:hypothetical protein
MPTAMVEAGDQADATVDMGDCHQRSEMPRNRGYSQSVLEQRGLACPGSRMPNLQAIDDRLQTPRG